MGGSHERAVRQTPGRVRGTAQSAALLARDPPQPRALHSSVFSLASGEAWWGPGSAWRARRDQTDCARLSGVSAWPLHHAHGARAPDRVAPLLRAPGSNRRAAGQSVRGRATAQIGRPTPRNVLTPEEVRRILDAPDPKTKKGIRDKAILETFYSTGIRLEEMARLTVHDVDLSGYVRVNRGKGAKDRVVPLGVKACD